MAPLTADRPATEPGEDPPGRDDQRRVLAVIPAYDEAPRVGAVVRGAARHLPVLVVDDGSTDTTADEAVAAGATALRRRPNQGKGAALQAGFRWAIEAGFDAVVTLDADGQHDPAEIPTFVAAYERAASADSTSDASDRAADPPADLLIGRRDLRRMPPVRRLANRLGGLAFSLAVGRRIPDNQSGYRLVSRRLMEVLLESRERGFEFEVEMIARCIARGFRLGWVPIRTIYRGEPSHIRPAHHVAHFLHATWLAGRIVRGRP